MIHSLSHKQRGAEVFKQLKGQCRDVLKKIGFKDTSLIIQSLSYPGIRTEKEKLILNALVPQ